MLQYKIDILTALKSVGFTTYRIRKEHIFGEAQLTALRAQKPIHWTTIEKLCDILNCQPSDIIENKKPL